MDETLNKYLKIIESDSNNIKAYVWLANYYNKNKDYAFALKYYKKAFELDSSNEYYCRRIGDTYKKLGEYAKASIYNNQAEKLEDNKIEKEVTEYIKIIKNNPDDAANYYSLGRYYERYSRYLNALEYYKKAFEINSKSEYYCNLIGKMYEKLGDHEEAKLYFESAIELNPHSKEKKALLNKIDNDQKIYIEDFFEGNHVQGSFAANACSDEIDVEEFYKIFKDIKNKENVKELYIEICDVDIEEEWPYSDTAFIVTSANEEEINNWFGDVCPSEINEHVSLKELEDGYKLYCLWWD